MNTRYDPTELFASTAPYYARYRSGYPPELFTELVDRFGLDGTQTVLDLPKPSAPRPSSPPAHDRISARSGRRRCRRTHSHRSRQGRRCGHRRRPR